MGLQRETLRVLERIEYDLAIIISRLPAPPRIILTLYVGVDSMNPEIPVGDEVIVQITTSTGAPLDPGTVTAACSDDGANTTVTVDPSEAFLTIVATAPITGDVLTVDGEVGGVPCTPGTATFDIVAAQVPVAIELSLGAPQAVPNAASGVTQVKVSQQQA